MRINIPRLILLSLLIGLCASCARLTQEANRAGNNGNGSDQNGYLMRSDSWLLFIQWTEVDGKLNGQLQAFAITGRSEKRSDISSHPFTGVTDGEKVSLNFSGTLWLDALGGKTWTGKLENGALTLIVPLKDGTLQPLKFTPATVLDYNNAVGALKREAEKTNANVQEGRQLAATEEAQRQERLQRQRAVEDSNQRVASLIGDLRNQAKNLSQTAQVDDVVSQFKVSLRQEQKTVAELKAAAAAESPMTGSKLRELQSILRQVESDKRQVESDVRSMESQIRSIESNMRPLKDGIQQLQSAWVDLKQAAINNPTNDPPLQFGERDIEREERVAQEVLTNAQRVIQNGRSQAKDFDNQAQKILDDARGFVNKLRAVKE